MLPVKLEETDKCHYCSGDGYFLEHDPNDPHIDGTCSNCPVKIPCSTCKGRGVSVYYKSIIIEKKFRRLLDTRISTIDDLPF